MNIDTLQVSNFKAVRDVTIHAAGRRIVVIGGPNGAGKSSILDAILAGLTGGKSMPDLPVRQGADRSQITVTLDDGLRVTRTIRPDGSGSLEIVRPDGTGPTRAPQAWLDGQLGAVAFDPLAFLAGSTPADDRRRADVLRRLVGVDVTDLDAEAVQLRTDRTAVGKARDTAQGALSLLPRHPDAPAAEVSVADLSRELAAALDQAATRDRTLAQADGAEEAARACDSRIAELQTGLAALDPKAAIAAVATRHAAERLDLDRRAIAEIRDLEARIAAVRARLAEDLDASARRESAECDRIRADTDAKRADLSQRIENNTAKAADLRTNAAASRAVVAGCAFPDAEAIRTKMASAEAENAKVRANAQHARAQAEWERLRDAYQTHSDRLDAIAAERAKRIAAATFPVPGLGFAEDGAVTYQGVPLSQASQAERLRVSVAIGLAANPTLRIVLVRDASLLDDVSMGLVAEMAESAGAQIWLERVGDGDNGAIVIEEGAVRETGQPSLL